MRQLFSRRAILRTLVSGAVFSATQLSRAAQARLREDEPEAQALHYVTDVRRAKNAKPGSRCGTCSLYAGDRKAAYGPCPIFDNKLVSTRGWCKAWEKM